MSDRLLQIVSFNSDAETHYHKGNADKIFSSVEPTSKLAIIGICGNSRAGKSFLLNLMLHMEDPSAILNEDTVFGGSEGIPFHSGTLPHTKGILMWSRPLKIKMANGETISVILMDSQGTFDLQNDRSVSVKTFAIANLLCSTLIFNKKVQMDLTDLEGLQLFINYGKYLKDNKGQHLIWLLRDFLDEECGGLNEKYVKEITSGSVGSRETSQCLVDVQQAFRKFSCFTVTEPEKALKYATAEVQSSVCGQHFIKGMHNFVSFVLRTIEPKTLQGSLMTAQDVQTYLENIVEAIQTGAAPELCSAVEAMENTSLTKAEQRAMDVCRKEMDTLPKNGVPAPEFEEKLQTLLNKTFEAFHSESIFCSDNKQKALKEKLKLNLEKTFADLRNGNSKLVSNNVMASLAKKLLNKYDTELQEEIGKKDFDPKASVIKRNCVQQLEKAVAELPQFDGQQELVKKTKANMETEIEQRYATLCKLHRTKVAKKLEQLIAKYAKKSNLEMARIAETSTTLRQADREMKAMKEQIVRQFKNDTQEFGNEQARDACDDIIARIEEIMERDLRQLKLRLDQEARTKHAQEEVKKLVLKMEQGAQEAEEKRRKEQEKHAQEMKLEQARAEEARRKDAEKLATQQRKAAEKQRQMMLAHQAERKAAEEKAREEREMQAVIFEIFQLESQAAIEQQQAEMRRIQEAAERQRKEEAARHRQEMAEEREMEAVIFEIFQLESPAAIEQQQAEMRRIQEAAERQRKEEAARHRQEIAEEREMEAVIFEIFQLESPAAIEQQQAEMRRIQEAAERQRKEEAARHRQEIAEEREMEAVIFEIFQLESPAAIEQQQAEMRRIQEAAERQRKEEAARHRQEIAEEREMEAVIFEIFQLESPAVIEQQQAEMRRIQEATERQRKEDADRQRREMAAMRTQIENAEKERQRREQQESGAPRRETVMTTVADYDELTGRTAPNLFTPWTWFE